MCLFDVCTKAGVLRVLFSPYLAAPSEGRVCVCAICCLQHGIVSRDHEPRPRFAGVARGVERVSLSA